MKTVERNGILALRIMSIAIAALLWIFVTWENRGERPAEKVVEASVTYNPPAGMMILNPIERVRVRVRGSEREIRQANPYLIDVQVELLDAGAGGIDVQLTAEQVLLPEKLEVVSIEPTSIHLQLDEVTQRLLPVRPRLTGEPAAGSKVVGRPRVRPQQVLVSGPSTVVGRLDSVTTSPVSLDGHALDFEESTLVLAPDPLVKIVNSQVVTVQVTMQQPEPIPESSR